MTYKEIIEIIKQFGLLLPAEIDDLELSQLETVMVTLNIKMFYNILEKVRSSAYSEGYYDKECEIEETN